MEEWYYVGTNKIHRTVIIFDCVKLGENNIFYPHCVIGIPGFIRSVNDFNGKVEIGNNNWFGCYSTIMIGKNGITEIGDNNLFMNYTNIGHNSSIGNNNEVGANSVIAGWSKIGDNNKIKISTSIRNRKVIGDNNLIGMGSVIVKDVENNSVIYGNPGRIKK